jgi:L-serine/L-threonine ammonia-lyase
MPLHIQTPLYSNPAINARLGREILLKMECYQPVGSFKMRGIGAVCEKAVADGATRLICSSGGNAGYAAAYAARQLKVPITVVVPESTGETARARIAAEDANLVVHGSLWDDADAHARDLLTDGQSAYIHPFDDPVVWAGHATMVDEVVRQGPKPEAVVVAVGGGGLMCGLLEGMQPHGWDDVPVLAVETDGAASFAASVEAGELVRLPKITSIATTLGAAQVTAQAMEWAARHPIAALRVTDRDAVDACLQFADELRVLVEPACGAALSLMYTHADMLEEFERVLMIVCGGAGVTLGQLRAWQASL